MGSIYWLGARADYAAHVGEMVAAYGLLADQISRETFEACLRLRVHGKWEPLEALRDPQTYCVAGIGLPHELHFVDCGAFQGANHAAGLAAGYEFGSYYAFEPDAKNLPVLTATLKGVDPAPDAACGRAGCGRAALSCASRGARGPQAT